MDSQHRKIELQSPSDLAYLASQIRCAARQKLNLHLPPVPSTPSTPDPLRTHVEALVDAFVATVLQGLRSNISINGLDVVARGRGGDDVEGRADAMQGVVCEGPGVSAAEQEEFEAFDEKLRARLAAGVARRDGLVAGISRHRRGTGAAAAAAWQARFEAEAGVLGLEVEGLRAGARRVEEQHVVGVGAVARADEVQRSWERAVGGLARLNQALPETRARLERCGHVVGYLDGEER